MTVSLRDAAGELGRVSGVKSLMAMSDDGYTRTFAVEGYLRVNPFEVEEGRADDPSSPAYSLLAWEGYDHDQIPTGDDLEASNGYGSVLLEFTRPAGYTRAPETLGQVGYGKDTGETAINMTALAVNPFDSPDTGPSIGDGTTGELSGLTEGEVAAVGVKLEFDDSVTVFTNADAEAYDYAGGQNPLTGAGRGVAIEVWRGNPGPLTAIQTTDPDTCAVGENVNIQISFDMNGTSTGRLEVNINGGGWTLVDASVTAGSSSANYTAVSGNNYQFRLRYNDVSPDDWATQVGTTSATCNLV